MTSRWEVIRSNWVNGNREYCMNVLHKIGKDRFLETVLTAIQSYRDLNHQSGDLQDLYEILRHYRREVSYGVNARYLS